MAGTGSSGDGDVQALEIPDPEKVPQPVRGDLKKLVVVVAKEGEGPGSSCAPVFLPTVRIASNHLTVTAQILELLADGGQVVHHADEPALE